MTPGLDGRPGGLAEALGVRAGWRVKKTSSLNGLRFVLAVAQAPKTPVPCARQSPLRRGKDYGTINGIFFKGSRLCQHLGVRAAKTHLKAI